MARARSDMRLRGCQNLRDLLKERARNRAVHRPGGGYSIMRSPRFIALTSFSCALALLTVPAGAAIKKASTAECAGLIDVFRNKPSASVKDEAITEYAPLV